MDNELKQNEEVKEEVEATCEEAAAVEETEAAACECEQACDEAETEAKEENAEEAPVDDTPSELRMTDAERAKKKKWAAFWDKVTTGLLIALMASPIFILGYIFLWFILK